MNDEQEIEFTPEDDGGEYQQTVQDLGEYKQEQIQKLHDDIYALILQHLRK